jgi:hypothetical protein
VNDIGRALEETATLGRTTLVELEKVEATVTELNSSMETLESDEAESFRRSQELENRVSALKT